MNVLETRIRTRSDLNKRSQRTMLGLVIFVLLLALGWGGWKLVEVGGRQFFSANPQFILRQVDVQNTGSLLSRDEILFHAGVGKGKNLFEIDLKTLRSNLALLPEIKKVEVTRQLPDRLIIRVEERIPVARVTAQKGLEWETYAIDQDGFIMSPNKTPVDGANEEMPLITGAKVSDLRVGSPVNSPEVFLALELIKRCEVSTLNAFLNIENIDVSRSHMLVVSTSDGMRVKVGLEFMDQNLRRLEYILNDARQRGLSVATADLTVDRDVPVVFRRAV